MEKDLNGHFSKEDICRANKHTPGKDDQGTSLVVQWLRLHDPNAGGLGSIPGQGTRSHMLQLKVPHAATKTQHSQINKY